MLTQLEKLLKTKQAELTKDERIIAKQQEELTSLKDELTGKGNELREKEKELSAARQDLDDSRPATRDCSSQSFGSARCPVNRSFDIPQRE